MASHVVSGETAQSAFVVVKKGILNRTGSDGDSGVSTDSNQHSAIQNGTINATGTVTCSVAMNNIYLRVKLERSNGEVKIGTTTDVYNKSRASGNAAVSCSRSGTWCTRVEYLLRAPSGYSPAYSANNFASPWKAVACGSASKGTADMEDAAAYEETFEIAVPATIGH